MTEVGILLLEGDLPPLQIKYDYTHVPTAALDNMVQFELGDAACRAKFAMPLELLTMLMANIMAASDKRKSGLVGIEKPRLVT